jgi:hypothetical protein
MRNHRFFGVVPAVLLGMSFLHSSPSSPHHHHHRTAGTHLGGTGTKLASATLAADHEPTALAHGERSPIVLLRLAWTDRTLGTIHLVAAPNPSPSSPVPAADDEGTPIGLLRPAGTRFVTMLAAWTAYQQAHTPLPPPVPAPAPKPVQAPALAAAVSHPAAPPARPVAPVTSAASGGVWARLRQCESGGNYADDTGNGYYGAYQFSAGTWHGLGYAGLPSSATPAVQDQAAQKLQARSGWGQWPACSRRLGLL